MEPTNAGRVGPAAPIAAAGAAAASADHPARRAPVREVFTTPGSSPRHAFVRTPWHPPQARLTSECKSTMAVLSPTQPSYLRMAELATVQP